MDTLLVAATRCTCCASHDVVQSQTCVLHVAGFCLSRCNAMDSAFASPEAHDKTA